MATFLLFIHTVNVVKCNTLLNTLSQDYLQEIVYFVEFCFFCQMRQLRHTGQIREVTACVDNPKYSIFSLHYWKQINNLTCNQILRVSYNDFKLSLHAVMYLFFKTFKNKTRQDGFIRVYLTCPIYRRRFLAALWDWLIFPLTRQLFSSCKQKQKKHVTNAYLKLNVYVCLQGGTHGKMHCFLLKIHYS